jgi:hypothetical protein
MASSAFIVFRVFLIHLGLEEYNLRQFEDWTSELEKHVFLQSYYNVIFE